MGRNKKPIELSKKNLTKEEKETRKKAEENIKRDVKGLKTPPKFLTDIGKKIWKKIVPELIEIGLADILDKSMLEGYCEAYSKWMDITQYINENKPDYVIDNADKPKENPIYAMQRRYNEEVRKYNRMIGIPSQLRISTGEKLLNEMKKTEEDEIDKEFGGLM